jgi:hypothetical protein
VLTTRGTYPWSFVTHIFHNGQPSHGGDRKIYFTFRYIDYVHSLIYNSRFGDFVDRIYPIELEIKDTTDTDGSASYLDLHVEIDSEGRSRTKLYHKRYYFNFPVVN